MFDEPTGGNYRQKGFEVKDNGYLEPVTADGSQVIVVTLMKLLKDYNY